MKTNTLEKPDQAAFELADLAAERRRAGRPYLEFLRVETLSAGLYELPAGGVDRQQPHAEDEVYYIAAGRGRFTAGEEDLAIAPGTILYVKAGVEHRFHTIDEDLQIVVLFAPPETGR